MPPVFLGKSLIGESLIGEHEKEDIEVAGTGDILLQLALPFCTGDDQARGAHCDAAAACSGDVQNGRASAAI